MNMTSAAEFSDPPRELADHEQGSVASDAVADAVAAQDAQDDAGESGANTPRVGVIYNPRSHRNKGKDLDANPAPHVFVAQPGARDQLPAALERFKRRGIDLLVINGGDGTVRDVLTCGYRVFGEHWPTIAVLPKGKTNALTVDLDAPGDWSLQDAIDAIGDGRRIWRHPLKISALDRKDPALLGFIFGAGAYATGINAGQEAHKLGAFNSLAVGLTTVWGVISASGFAWQSLAQRRADDDPSRRIARALAAQRSWRPAMAPIADRLDAQALSHGDQALWRERGAAQARGARSGQATHAFALATCVVRLSSGTDGRTRAASARGHADRARARR